MQSQAGQSRWCFRQRHQPRRIFREDISKRRDGTGLDHRE